MADEARGGDTLSGKTISGKTISGKAADGKTAGGNTGGGTRDRPAREPRWAPVLRLARWLLGAFSLVGGVTWIMLNLHLASAVLDTAVGSVLAAGGLVLLMPHRIRLPRTATAITMTVTAVLGTAAGLLAGTAKYCCDVAYIVDRGWPFHWVQRGALADDSVTAYRLAQSGNWQVDLVSLSANLLVWAYAGLVVVVIAVLVRRARGDRSGLRS